MDIEAIRLYALSMPHATECFPFDDVNLVFKVAGKMFLVIPLDKPSLIIMKCDPARSIDLRERYSGIMPAWHFNKKYWNQIILDGSVHDSMVKSLITHSYDEVVKKLPRRTRTELGL